MQGHYSLAPFPMTPSNMVVEVKKYTEAPTKLKEDGIHIGIADESASRTL